jgi:flagellar capping protein FliD
MAINSTSSATSASTTSTSGVGKGSVIDVESIVSKLDSIEQAPIDKLSVKVTSQDNSIRDLGIIKDKTKKNDHGYFWVNAFFVALNCIGLCLNFS